MGGPLLRPERHLVAIAAAVGLVITCGLVYISLDKLISREQREFDAHATMVGNLIAQRANVVEAGIESLARLFNSSLNVDADQFRLYVDDMLQRHPYLRSAYHLPLVSRNDRQRFEARMQDDGYAGFGIRELEQGRYVPAADRERYYPVLYLRPFTPLTARLLGYDMLSDARYLQAILRTIDSGKPVLTRPAAGETDPQYVLFLAIYAGREQPVDLFQRNANVNGLLALALDTRAMVSDLPGLDDMVLYLRDLSGGLPGEAVFSTSGPAGGPRDPDAWALAWHNSQGRIRIGDRQLQIDLRKPFRWSEASLSPLLFPLLAGLVTTGFLMLLGANAQRHTRQLASRNMEINALVSQRTQELASEKARLELEIERRHRAQNESIWLSRLLDESSNEIYVFDAETCLFIKVNQGALKNLGYTPEQMHRLAPWDLKPEFNETRFKAVLRPMLEGRRDRLVFETTHIRNDGSCYPVEVRLHLSRSTGRALFVAVIEDITERVRYQRHLHHLAHHDVLTGLPNRALFVERLDHGIAQAQRQGTCLAVLFLDLDRFKIINDTMGHEYGDRLLQKAAQVLQHSLRASDTVARLGGDEFTILLENLNEEIEAGAIADKIRKALTRPLRLDGHNICITSSIGIATYPENGDNAMLLLKNADAAMYRAKGRGKNNCQFYRAQTGENTLEQMKLENALRHALERDEYVLHYQPKIHLESGRQVGLEALLRWQHPGKGLISPDRFIHLLEETGQINQVGEWALNKACETARQWQDDTAMPVPIAVNLSTRQFGQPALLDTVESILERTGLDPCLLELELTESLVMQDAETAIETLNQLSDMGVRIAIDDFGTGYSSLNYLRLFPIDTLKVDRSFIKELPHNADSAAIVKTVITMARSLKIETVAEGVETEEQARLLREWSCHSAQGHLYSPPLPAHAVPTCLERLHRPASRKAMR